VDDSVAPVGPGVAGPAEIVADVVIVGSGCAGTAAAIEAGRAGLETVILERAGGSGGASAMSGGSLYLGGGTALQTACGVEDTPEEMFRFVMAVTSPGADEAKIDVYCRQSVEHFDWVVGCGVPFKASLYTGTFPEPLTDDGLMFTGGENAWPYAEQIRAAPRGHVPEAHDKRPLGHTSGVILMRHLIATAEGLSGRWMLDTQARRLVRESDGRVTGVVARSEGSEIHVRARRGVVLAGGGFVFNDDMLRHHAPRLLGKPKLGTDGDDGRCIRMAQAAGAGVRHMEAAEAAYGLPELYLGGILVNSVGQRFINEDTYFGRIGQAVMFSQDGRAYAIIDDAVNESLSDIGRFYPAGWVGADADELGQAMGLPDGVLRATVEYYNRHAAEGRDPLFHKGRRWLRPLEAPLGAIELADGAFMAFTLGGLHTDVHARVLDVGGEPIPGLYAAGRTTSGVPGWGYCSGMSLGDGTFFGRQAGRHLAKAGAGSSLNP
jgi:3-oxo-5alpha-steroid 4-dehydrogenase